METIPELFMPFEAPRPVLDRRTFLFGATAAASCLTASPGLALPFLRRAQPEPTGAPRSLMMIHQQTEEVFNEVYFDGTIYDLDALGRFAHFARDLRTNEVGEMNPHLLDLASDIQHLAGADAPLILTHGFRSSSRNIRGGASNSHHLHGQALDIAHHSLSVGALHQHAVKIGRGGLGRYSTFIHIDIGETRRW